MAGSATLNSAVLIDGLVGVIDGLRGSLHPLAGIRPYRTYTVLRTYDGRRVGEGDFSELVAELTPAPRVMAWEQVSQQRYELAACGLDTVGEIALTEVSLSYTFAEIAGPTLEMNQQWIIRLTEGHGQANPPRDYVLQKPPFVDREKDMGWMMWLRHFGASR